MRELESWFGRYPSFCSMIGHTPYGRQPSIIRREWNTSQIKFNWPSLRKRTRNDDEGIGEKRGDDMHDGNLTDLIGRCPPFPLPSGTTAAFIPTRRHRAGSTVVRGGDEVRVTSAEKSGTKKVDGPSCSSDETCRMPQPGSHNQIMRPSPPPWPHDLRILSGSRMPF